MLVRRILVVDDAPDMRAIAELSLTALGGFEVELAASGAEAIERVAAHTPDLVLLDVMMPGMDGIETLARLRAESAGAPPPVVFLTADAREADVSRYLALGAVGVIAKPFDPMDLPERIRELVAGLP